MAAPNRAMGPASELTSTRPTFATSRRENHTAARRACPRRSGYDRRPTASRPSPASPAISSSMAMFTRGSVAGGERLGLLQAERCAVERQRALARLGAQHFEADALVRVPLPELRPLGPGAVGLPGGHVRVQGDHRGPLAGQLDV